MAQIVGDAELTPTRQSRLINKTPFFYGWVILIAGTVSSVMMGPSQTFTVGLFTDTFVTELGLSRSSISLLYGIATLAASLMLPITGRLVDRYGPRKMMVIVSLLFVLSCASMSLVMGFASLLIALLILRFLGYGSTLLVSSNVIAQWFVRRRGLVMGLAGQALAISLLFWPALAEKLIQALGWRMAWIGISIIVLAIAVPVAVLFYRDRPELYGQQPDGDGELSSIYSVPVNEENWTLSEAIHTGIFWVFLCAFLIISTVFAGMIFHQSSIFAAQGLSRETAVSAFQVMAIVSIVGNLAMGRLLDIVSARLLLVSLLITMTVSVWFIHSMNTPFEGFIYASMMGLTMGGYRVMDSTVWAKYYGRRHLGSIRGVTMVGTLGGTALGVLPLGLSYDLTGSYATAMNVFMTLPFAIYIAMLFVKRPIRPSITDSAA